ncbi:MAG TPA: MgtC/SapB family protein, partial [Planctomycetota bacterium]|nr:MgtC/SapB family protein [Planctomycetota bacterium]
MEDYEPFASLGVALAAGLLIGLQRQQSGTADARKGQQLLGGIRTFPLIALTGAISMLLSRQAGMWVVAAALVAVALPPILAYADDLRKGLERGITTETAIVVTFLLGALSLSVGVIEPLHRKLLVVTGGAVIVTALLSLKTPLHRMVANLSEEDILAAVKFLVLAVIVLPLLPDEAYGPLKALNPFHIGMMIVLIALISFVGFIAVRVLGPGRGLGVTGLLGGLVSSTAVTLSVSVRARSNPQVANACALAVVLASTVMLLRVAVEVSVVNAALLPVLLAPLGAMTAMGLLTCLFFHRWGATRAEGAEALSLKNPFQIGPAVKFGLFFAVVLLGFKAAETYLGHRGLYVAAAVAGLADVDAITITMARMVGEGMPSEVAATGILIGIASNTLVKASLAISLGGWAYGRKVLAALLAMIAAGGAG